MTIGPSQKHQFVYMYRTCVLCQLLQNYKKTFKYLKTVKIIYRRQKKYIFWRLHTGTPKCSPKIA